MDLFLKFRHHILSSLHLLPSRLVPDAGQARIQTAHLLWRHGPMVSGDLLRESQGQMSDRTSRTLPKQFEACVRAACVANDGGQDGRLVRRGSKGQNYLRIERVVLNELNKTASNETIRKPLILNNSIQILTSFREKRSLQLF